MTLSIYQLSVPFHWYRGEQAALALMRGEADALFLTDDSAARLAAVQMGIKVHGTIGIIIRAVRRDQKTTEEIIELLQSIPQKSTLHIRTDLLTSIIDRVKREIGLL